MIQYDAAKRARLRELAAEVRELESPEREAAKIKRAQDRRKRNKALVRSEGQRDPRQEEPTYLAWIRGLPCIGCLQDQTPSRSMRCEAAHVRYADARAGWSHTGKGEKPHDRRTLPLCLGHHREGPKAQHAAGERAWWERRHISPPALCAALSAAYDAGEDGAAIIRRFVADAPRPQDLGMRNGGEAGREATPKATTLTHQPEENR